MADNSTPAAAAVAAVSTEANTGAEVKTAAAPDEAFARKERQIRQAQKQLQAERAQWMKERESKDTEYKTNYVPKSRLTEDPLSVLMEAGITTEKLSQMLLEQPNQNDPTVRALKAEIKAIKDAQDQQKKWAEDQQSQQYEQAKNQIANEAKLLIDSDPEFETIKAEGMHDAVTQLIVDTFDTEGRLMDVREAALEVENYLIEQGTKFASYNKVKAKLAPKTEPQVEPAKTRSVTTQLKTLTNNLQQQAPSKKSADAERMARAIAAFQGKISG